jgi:hypothetical protein
METTKAYEILMGILLGKRLLKDQDFAIRIIEM